MDFSKFKTSDWLKVGGALGFLIFGFLHWTTVSFGGAEASGNNVFHFFFTGTIPWILIIGTGVLSLLLLMGTMKAGKAPWPLIFLLATGLAALLLLIRLIFNPVEGDNIPGIDVGRGIGLWLSVIAGLVCFAGAFMGFKEAGGDFNDLKDMNKMKAAFQSGGSGATPPPPPPPPPGGMTPPPPPPPPAG